MCTAASCIGAPVAASASVNLTVVGTPSAVPVEGPKLDRMSFRTTPDCASAFTPLDPSPGNGPAVSSGIVPVADSPVRDVPVVDVDGLALDPPFDAQLATASTAAPPRSWS